MKQMKSLLRKNTEFLNFIPNGTLVATGLLMVNFNIKAKTDSIFQFIYIYIYIYIYTHTHTYIHIYTHAYTHTQTHTSEATLLRA